MRVEVKLKKIPCWTKEFLDLREYVTCGLIFYCWEYYYEKILLLGIAFLNMIFRHVYSMYTKILGILHNMFKNKLLLYSVDTEILYNTVYLFKNALAISTQKLTIKHIELIFRHDFPIIITMMVVAAVVATVVMVATVAVAVAMWRVNDGNGGHPGQFGLFTFSKIFSSHVTLMGEVGIKKLH